MNEIPKTLIVTIIAVALAVAAVVIKPKPVRVDPNEFVNTILFDEFEDPLTAKSLEVLQYNEDLSEIEQFKVAEIDGVWCIPSHNNYPADAENKVRDAATILSDVTVIAVATEQSNEHELFGVKEPKPDELEAGDEGIGTLIALQDKQGKDLATLIVGKKVKDANDQRFVRKPGQDPVYVVKIDPEKLSTQFEDWIKTDLLDINTWDIKEVLIQDYSVQTQLTLQGARVNYNQRMQMQLNLENSSDWQLTELKEWRDDELYPTELLDDEELNKDRLNEMKDAFDDLEIVDVERKPAGLRANLRADKNFMENKDNFQSLFERGFYPVDVEQDGQLDLLSSDGEVLVRTDNGVEYVLRFGQIAGGDEGNLNRYLFVTTRLWKEKFSDLKPDETSSGEVDQEKEAEEAKDGDDQTKKTEEERQRDEQEEKRKTAEEKIRDLNDYFAEWYYIISEDVFKKIHLGRADVIKKNKESKEGFDLETFQELKKGPEENSSDSN